MEPSIRLVESSALSAVFPVLRELRRDLDEAAFHARLSAARTVGYELIAAFDGDGAVLGVLGMRPLTTFARGEHLHVDDLVVTAAARGRGIGAALLAFAEQQACARGHRRVFLDARHGVESFYVHRGYQPHASTPMRRDL